MWVSGVSSHPLGNPNSYEKGALPPNSLWIYSTTTTAFTMTKDSHRRLQKDQPNLQNWGSPWHRMSKIMRTNMSHDITKLLWTKHLVYMTCFIKTGHFEPKWKAKVILQASTASLMMTKIYVAAKRRVADSNVCGCSYYQLLLHKQHKASGSFFCCIVSAYHSGFKTRPRKSIQQ